MFDERYSYYICSICGHVSQVLKTVKQDILDDFGNVSDTIDVIEFDGDASFEKVLEHEETHKK
jgi:hypothetical protein